MPVSTLRPLSHQPSIPCMARELIAIGEHYYWDSENVVGTPHAIFQYTVRGEGRLDYRGKTYRLTPGSAFFVHNTDPDLAYYSCPESGQEWEILWCNVTPGETLAADMIDRHGPHYYMPPDSWFVGRLRHFLFSGQDFVQLSLAESLRLTAGLIIELADCSARVSPKDSSGQLMQAFCEFVHTRIDTPLSVADAADHLNISREHLTRTCQEQLHTSPGVYISDVKIREAVSQLRNPQNSIKEVAHRLGYDDASHFSRVFRRLVGVSPREFRSAPQHHPISPLMG
ncbi:MAG: AraC family transcriptional regulator [Planctomycetota bacterium]